MTSRFDLAGAAALILCLAAAGPTAEQDARRTVQVEEGDTLWDLAARYLGAGGRWTLIQRANPDRLTSPRQLRPGMELVIPVLSSDTTPRLRPEESLFFRDEGEGIGGFTVGARRGLSRVSPTEFARVPFLYDLDEARPPMTTLGRFDVVRAGRELPVSLRQRDRVRVAVGRWEVEAGDRLQAIRWESQVADHGRVARPVAVLQVLERRGDTAVAEVSELYGFYRVDTPVLPLPETPDLRGSTMVAAGGGPDARMVGPAVDRPVVVPGAAVFLDVGAESGIRPGDEFVVPSRSGSLDQHIAARLRVIRAQPETATARVLEIREPVIRPGTEVRLDRRVASGGEG